LALAAFTLKFNHEIRIDGDLAYEIEKWTYYHNELFIEYAIIVRRILVCPECVEELTSAAERQTTRVEDHIPH
jgi:hypothetical protein